MSEENPTADRVTEGDAGLFDAVVNLAKRRGFIFPSAEIYGGIRSTYDYGPLGALMLRNVRDAWWRTMVRHRDDVVPIEAAIITNPKVWEASGHLETFVDPLVDCRSCHERWRADQIEGTCPNCGSADLTEARPFNLMFKTFVGALENESSIAYLRPETAQGIFANFKNVVDTGRVKLPFGIAQVGKSFRNEINPRNFTFRSREFEQMEIEYFCRPEEAKDWYAYWRQARFQWYVDLGLRSDRLRLRDHDAEELSFYSTATADIEFAFPFGISELEGIAHRGDYDLTQHMKHSGKDLSYFDEERKERLVPHVVEPSAGADRATLAFLCEAYAEDQVGGEPRTVLKFHPRIAPIKAAIFPLVKRDGMPEKAEAIYRDLRRHFHVFYDEKGAIGRRYRRQDEAGTPFCITVDSQTLAEDTVTFRDRDSCRQWRVPIAGVVQSLRDLLEGQAIAANP